jgi:hypothetical protein
MRMDAVRPGGIVLEVNDDGIANFGADERPEDAEVLPFLRPLLFGGVSVVGVFAKQGLAIDLADAVFGVFGPDFRLSIRFGLRMKPLLTLAAAYTEGRVCWTTPGTL